MRHVEPKNLSIREVLSLLQGGVTPRPIALVATISKNGNNNLAPFSFFNAFGANPPMVAFSPSRRVRDGTTKHTYYNLKRTKECTIQVVTFNIVEQVNLASTEYEEGVDEFVKSGLTPVPSDLVKPSRVKESPFQMECVLNQIVELGNGKGSGSLMICEVIKFHIAEEIFKGNIIDPSKIDVVARNGANYYTRASGSAIFEVEKPLTARGIGYDQLPQHMKESKIFTANNLARFGNSEKVPNPKDVLAFIGSFENASDIKDDDDKLKSFEKYQQAGDYKKMLALAISLKKENYPQAGKLIERTAQEALNRNDLEFAWKTALYAK